MYKHLAIVLSLVILGSGCGLFSQNTLPESDFNPPSGPTAIPDGQTAEDGAYVKELRTAISYDGLTFVPNGGWISAQANAPNMVVDGNGTIYLYYSGWVVGNKVNVSAVAMSQDEGQTWVYKYINVDGLEKLQNPMNPDVVLLDDETFRMFFTSGDWVGRTGIYYADSLDGINFDFRGNVAYSSEMDIYDSTTFLIDGIWNMYALTDGGTSELVHLTSTDGEVFEMVALTSFPIEGRNYMPSNGIWLDGKFHLFMFNPAKGDVRSFRTDDGFDWYEDEDVRISPDDDNEYIKDPAIIPISEDRYLMVYVARSQE